MLREEMVSEISMRTDIPMEDVEDVLEERDVILEEECRCKKRKKRICIIASILVFISGAVAAIILLDRKDKIDLEAIEDMVRSNAKRYTEKYAEKYMDIMSKIR